ncbi:hypothetical protein [Sulfurimonas sp.]|uniref:hypothetical protein n=1 Tax=Sulfurimonas sp. TaxID=2022749 RepID=UPI001A0029F3|nr:hypothetical protein [Sulfurimonas sp.]MBE0515397.1 hypothetical protein [Sulfurimonas sp.]
MINEKVEKALKKLQLYIEKEEYKGWDPYDALNSDFINKMTSFHPSAQRVAIHLLKNSPFNMRNIFGIEKDYNPTALSLFIDGYVNLHQIYKDETYIQKANELKDLLYSLACINNQDEIGWGRNFKFITSKETHELDKPLTFLNAKLTLSLLNLYVVTQDGLILANTKKAIYSILKNGRVFETKEGVYVGYSSDSQPRYIFNASILTAELIMKYLYFSNQETEIVFGIDIKKLAQHMIDTVLEKQQSDGKWYYGYNYDFSVLRNVDFHQGFVADALLGISKHSDYKKEDVINAYKAGIEFMHKEQISDDGRFKWRLPKEYPVDIHNQAQGIISLSRIQNKAFEDKLEKLLHYTFEYFLDKKNGYFYYQKNRFHTIKIPFIRWGDGWMFFALSEYLKNKARK